MKTTITFEPEIEVVDEDGEDTTPFADYEADRIFNEEYADWMHDHGLDRPMTEDELRALYVAEFAPCGVAV